MEIEITIKATLGPLWGDVYKEMTGPNWVGLIVNDLEAFLDEAVFQVQRDGLLLGRWKFAGDSSSPVVFMESLTGLALLEVEEENTCPQCDGAGRLMQAGFSGDIEQNDIECSRCNGKGFLEATT